MSVLHEVVDACGYGCWTWQIFKYEQEGACGAAGGEALPDLCGEVHLGLSPLVRQCGSVPLFSGLSKLECSPELLHL